MLIVAVALIATLGAATGGAVAATTPTRGHDAVTAQALGAYAGEPAKVTNPTRPKKVVEIGGVAGLTTCKWADICADLALEAQRTIEEAADGGLSKRCAKVNCRGMSKPIRAPVHAPSADAEPHRPFTGSDDCDAPETAGDGGCEGELAYHYTTASGIAGIVACRCINPSTSDDNNAAFGHGVYWTDFTPGQAASVTPGQFSYALTASPRLGWNGKFGHFVGVDASTLAVQPERVAPTFGPRFPGTSIFLSRTSAPLPVQIRSLGATR